MPIPVPLEPPDPRDLLIAQLRQQVADRDAGIAARDSVIRAQSNAATTAAITMSTMRARLDRCNALLNPAHKTITKAELRVALR